MHLDHTRFFLGGDSPILIITIHYITNMFVPSTPPISPRLPGIEIKTNHKESIRQLYKFAKVGLQQTLGYYDLAYSTVRKILSYDVPKRVRPTHTGRPREYLNTQEVRDIIEYISTDHTIRELNWAQLHDKLNLKCSPKPLNEVKTKLYTTHISNVRNPSFLK